MSSKKHKGHEGDAYLVFLGMLADDDFNPNTLIPALFNEQNFNEEQLLELSTLVTDSTGARIIMSHPNSTMSVKAKLAMIAAETLSTVPSIEIEDL